MRFLSLAFLLSLTTCSLADTIDVVGLFPGKAVLIVNGLTPKTYSVNNQITPDSKLISVSESDATIEIGGKQITIAIGQHVSRSPVNSNAKVTLQANNQGHFITNGQINGSSLRMLVDTGASVVSISAKDAINMGIDYKKGEIGLMNTANGQTTFWRVTLNSVKVGDIELNQVEGAVQESALPFALLGMSFLNRMQMQRDGEKMTLTKRF